MRHSFKCLLLPFAVAITTYISVASADDTVHLTGTGANSSYNNSIISAEPSKFYGPTNSNETLWSIASKLRPSNQYTVQQMLLAIFQLNPQAFEQQNIHSLIPGSTLRVPSEAQIARVSTDSAVQIMEAHQARLDQQNAKHKTTVPAPVVVQSTSVAKQPKQTVTTVATETGSGPTSPAKTPLIIPDLTKAAPKLALDKMPDMSKLEQKLDDSGSEIMALEEKNHRLLVMLTKVQSEVDELKSTLDDESRIRNEVEKLLAQERLKREQENRVAPSTLDLLLDNWWLVGGLALGPGALLALVVSLLLGRRAKKAPNEAGESQSEMMNAVDDVVAIGGGMATDDHELDDLNLDDDLFAVASEKEQEDEEETAVDENVFSSLEDLDLDLNLESDGEDDLFAGIDDDGDLDPNSLSHDDFDDLPGSSNGISVNGSDKALGLEEMERALADVSVNSRSVQNVDDADEELFDLSDDEDEQISELDDIDALIAQNQNYSAQEIDLSNGIDQSMIDDLLAGAEEFELEDEFDLGDELELSDAESELTTAGEAEGLDDFDPDELLKQFGESGFAQDDTLSAFDEPVDTSINWDDELDAIDGIDLSEDDEPEDEDIVGTELLDELLGGEELSSDISIDEPVEADLGLDEDDFGFDLDEDLSDENILDADAETALLDELIEDEEIGSINTPVELSLDEDEATALFEELDKIEQQGEFDSQDEISGEFNRDEFVEDLESSIPEKDPLFDEFDFDDNQDSETDVGLRDKIDFSSVPEADEAEHNPAEPESEPAAQVVANEFGIPQDEDWEIEESEESAVSEPGMENQPEPTDSDVSEVSEKVESVEQTTILEEPEPEPEPEPELSADQPEDTSVLDRHPDVVEPEVSETIELTEPNIIDESAEDEFVPETAPDSEDTDQEEPVQEEQSEEESDRFDFFDDDELPEFGEEEAFVSIEGDDVDHAFGPLTDQFESETDASRDEPEFIADNELPEFDENEAMASFDESQISTLLDEEADHTPLSKIGASLDDDLIATSGMDMDTMLDDMDGEDWNGFRLSEEQKKAIDADVPAEEQAIWQNEQNHDPEVEDENWAVQDDIDDVELDRYKTIGELMAHMDEDGDTFVDEDLKLDVGLHEFPDVIGQINDVDVDSNAEAAGKLDLAKIYIEMNDEKGAIKLLEEAIVDGDDDIRREAKHLIDTLNRG